MTRQAILIKWSLYSVSALVLTLLQGLILVHLNIGGVHPFLLPAIAVIPATLERDGYSMLFAIFFGLLCDLLMPVAGLACFYCLAFALAVTAARLLSSQVLAAGLICSLTVTAASFLVCGALHAIVLGDSSAATAASAAILTGKELAVSLPFTLIAHFLYRWVCRHTSRD